MVPYPKEFPVDAITAIIHNISAPGGGKLAHAVWNLGGYGLAVAFGDPDAAGLTVAYAASATATDDELLAALDALNRAASVTQAADYEAIPPELWAMLLQAAIALVQRIIENRRKPVPPVGPTT